MSRYDLGLVGNGNCSALVGLDGSVDWLCLPRPDSPPLFGRLLDPQGGHFQVSPVGSAKATQSYLPNTNVLQTRFDLQDGSAFRVIDFCPRFAQYGRVYRPLALFRRIEPLAGRPAIRVHLKPIHGWEKTVLPSTRGNSHLRFERADGYFRLATGLSLTHLEQGTEVGLDAPAWMALTWDAPLEDDLETVGQDFLRKTVQYWENWVKHCNIPSRHQEATIRSALALKLHTYDDTGAILAALSSSLPEQAGGVRNWDYRYCWLRDAFFSLQAFNKLGHFEEMEGFITYLLDLVRDDASQLAPVYRLDRSLPLPELEHAAWDGFRGGKPVRSGNQAAEHVQNDVYGEMLLTLAPVFLDGRFAGLRNENNARLVERLARRCMAELGKPDAGLWELRGASRPHNFTTLMHWAGLDRALHLKERGFLKLPQQELEAGRARAEALLRAGAKDGAWGGVAGSADADASMLLAPVLRFPDRALCEGTLALVRRQLAAGGAGEGFLYRYRERDDFGEPGSAFVVCSFWLVQALARLGRMEEARAAMEQALRAGNHLGLFAEHYDPATATQLGNFPQAYSHVGLINAAFAVSEPWDEVL